MMIKNIMNKLNLPKDGQKKIENGLAIIILSPLLGSLLFYIYSFVIGSLISTDGAVAMFWFSCILIIAILGTAIILVGCNDKIIEQERQKNKTNE